VPLSSRLSSSEREFTVLLTGLVIFRTSAAMVKYVSGRLLKCVHSLPHIFPVELGNYGKCNWNNIYVFKKLNR
jgi:hypothetical protein